MADDVALLLRRAGFEPNAADLAAARQLGYAATLSALLAPPGPDVGAASAPLPQLGPDPYTRWRHPTSAQQDQADTIRRSQTNQITQWWLDRMTVATHQTAEKLVFFWHGHWATSVTKVKSPQLMLGQNIAFREARDVADLAHRMVVDPALVYWLDGQLNTRTGANENLARELMELFMLGIGQYTEQDVKEASRALTGLRLDLAAEKVYLDPADHDTTAMTILGVTARFDPQGLVDLLLRQPAAPRFIASRLWYRYASSTDPIPGRVQDAMVAAFPDPLAMLRALFQDDAFRGTRDRMVKQPVEWFVGAMRQLGLRPANLDGDTFTQFADGLAGLGQRVFAPPSVGGWPSGMAWLTSAAARVRLSLAGKLARLAGQDRAGPDEAAHLLGVDRWTDRTYAVLRTAGRGSMLLALALVSPEYLVT